MLSAELSASTFETNLFSFVLAFDPDSPMVVLTVKLIDMGETIEN